MMTEKQLLNKYVLFSSTPLFSRLEASTLDALIKITKNKQLNEGEVVFRQGQPANDMFIIAEGRVRVSMLLEDGKDINLGTLGPGDTFGEIALFDRKERTATITAIEIGRCLVIERDVFETFLRRYPEVAFRLLAALSYRLRVTDRLIKETLCFDIPSCLAQKLLELAKGYGQHTDKGIRVNAVFSEADLVEITGLPVQNITAQMRIWQNQGLIKYRNGNITIINPKEMERLV